MANKTLATLRSDEQNTYAAYTRAMNAYLATDTESVETPAYTFEYSLPELAAFNPIFAVAEARRARMEILASAWYAAKAELAAYGTQYSLPYCGA